MILRKLQDSPAKILPFAMMFVSLGMMFLVMAIVWPRFFLPAHLGPGWSDFLRGATFGVAIALELTGVVISMVAATRAKRL
jgi:hypothetical protein